MTLKSSSNSATREPGAPRPVEVGGFVRAASTAVGSESEDGSNASIDGIVIGRLVAVDPRGAPMIDFPGRVAGAPVEARALVPCGRQHVGKQVAIMFDQADPNRPILLGFIQHLAPPPLAETPVACDEAQSAIVADVDQRRIELNADQEIVLKCGKASITLTRAGKVIIRGAYVLSRSSGVHRIKGGSVQIN